VIGHYKQAEVNGKLYLLGDCVHVHSGLETNFIGRIIEFFEKEDKSEWFGVQWFFRTFDTAIGTEDRDHDKKRVFYSDVKDDNPLECIVENVNVVRVPSLTRFDKGERVIPPCDYYFDKGYKFAYATFYELPAELPGEWDNHTSWNMFQDCSPCAFRGCSYVSASFSHGQ
jgi:DNA (cytosine-5)-methyltransferase 1